MIKPKLTHTDTNFLYATIEGQKPKKPPLTQGPNADPLSPLSTATSNAPPKSKSLAINQ
jgi:hypothetical protein